MTKIDNISLSPKSLKEILPSEDNQNSNTIPNSSKQCPKFDNCSAPICPAETVSAIWYPDEQVCPLRAFTDLPWIRRQRAIAKKAKDTSLFFNSEMLQHDCIIRTGVRGIDPDSTVSEEKLTRDWIKDHPLKPILSNEERQLRAERLRRVSTINKTVTQAEEK